MGHDLFVTAINCMDGRTQLPVIEWMKATYGADYVDTITEPGPNKILSENTSPLVESIKRRVAISVEKHGSKVVALIAHGDCAGNPVGKEESLKQAKDGIETIRSWGLSVKIVGLWVDDYDWTVKRID